ncbi:MAG: DNA-directed RNA polymerase subunit omega [Acidobacteria bacterium]|jgi:hypothetical protein|nr:DNA-directed RNA polymerase subunit omega [Acidobacteriota bacterium]
MRSDLIYDALRTVQNRYVLCQVASKATRKFHRPNTRVQDTMNEVFERFAKSDDAGGIVGQNQTAAEARRRAA